MTTIERRCIRPGVYRVGMEGSRFVVRHVDVSVAAPETIWRWRGWATTDPADRLRDHRSLDVYKDGKPHAMPVVGIHQPLGAELQDALGLIEWAAASTLAGAQDAWRPTLGALRSARRGTFRHRSLPTIRRSTTPRTRLRPQPVYLHRISADVTNVWEGATIRLVATRGRVELHVRSPGSFQLGDVPTPLQKALRYGAESMRQSAIIQLHAAARVMAGRIPSHEHVADLLDAHRPTPVVVGR
jgi:hypothetical protein